MLNFLQTNNIMDMAGLDEKFKAMIGEQMDIQNKLKPIERRMGTLKQHQMAWVSAMNHVRSIAEEAILSDLIYC